jgi:hypothetical protein
MRWVLCGAAQVTLTYHTYAVSQLRCATLSDIDSGSVDY